MHSQQLYHLSLAMAALWKRDTVDQNGTMIPPSPPLVLHSCVHPRREKVPLAQESRFIWEDVFPFSISRLPSFSFGSSSILEEMNWKTAKAVKVYAQQCLSLWYGVRWQWNSLAPLHSQWRERHAKGRGSGAESKSCFLPPPPFFLSAAAAPLLTIRLQRHRSPLMPHPFEQWCRETSIANTLSALVVLLWPPPSLQEMENPVRRRALFSSPSSCTCTRRTARDVEERPTAAHDFAGSPPWSIGQGVFSSGMTSFWTSVLPPETIVAFIVEFFWYLSSSSGERGATKDCETPSSPSPLGASVVVRPQETGSGAHRHLYDHTGEILDGKPHTHNVDEEEVEAFRIASSSSFFLEGASEVEPAGTTQHDARPSLPTKMPTPPTHYFCQDDDNEEKYEGGDESVVQRQRVVQWWYDRVDPIQQRGVQPQDERCPCSNEEKVTEEAMPLPVQRVGQILYTQRVEAITQLQAALPYDFFSSCGA